ncbi:MAG: cytosine deaminase [Betaproteobacteria bacterium]|nr:cytosine deaminase [Betaproteobacteria bacterium]
MKNDEHFGRREFLATLGALSAVSAAGCAQSPVTTRATGQLPSRGELVVRDAFVLSMDPKIGDLPRGDVHVRGGEIVAVGVKLAAPGATEIDGRDMLVMPGFVDTHWHLWTSALRALVRNDDAVSFGYFPMTARLGPQFTPEDCLRSASLGIAEALHSGITTVHDWNHNILSPAHADAGLRAIGEAGIRARFAYGYNGRLKDAEPMDLADLARVKSQLAASNERLITLGMSSRGIAENADMIRTRRLEWAATRKLGLPITMHAGNTGQVALLEREGLLGPDLQLVHPTMTSAAEMKLLAASRTSFSTSPVTETRRTQERGDIQLMELLNARIQVSLSVDHIAGLNCDFFNQMRVLHWNHQKRIGDKVPLSTRRIVELATMDGARDLGLSDRIGSLTPGKRADLIMLRTNDINIAPVIDPTHSLVFAAQPSNVDTAMVDGRILMRGGKLTAMDENRVVRDAAAAAMELQKRAGWP